VCSVSLSNNEQSNKRRRPRVSALLWARSRDYDEDPGTTLARASDYIRHLADLARDHHGVEVVLYIRVSGRMQDRRGTLDRQERFCRRRLAEMGCEVVKVYREVGSGWRLAPRDRQGLADAADYARRRGTILVAESVSRLVRSVQYHSVDYPTAQPTKKEYEQLRFITEGVILATIHAPDATPGQERSQQTRRGEPGRRAKRKRRCRADAARLRAKARRLRSEGYSLGEIAEELKCTRSSVQGWVS
jgi:hypothetical protein